MLSNKLFFYIKKTTPLVNLFNTGHSFRRVDEFYNRDNHTDIPDEREEEKQYEEQPSDKISKSEYYSNKRCTKVCNE